MGKEPRTALVMSIVACMYVCKVRFVNTNRQETAELLHQLSFSTSWWPLSFREELSLEFQFGGACWLLSGREDGHCCCMAALLVFLLSLTAYGESEGLTPQPSEECL